jgi:hypothetical protein
MFFQIMSTTQSIVHTRRIDDSKLNRTMATSKLEQMRGFSVAPESTFHQTKKLGSTGAGAGKSGEF